MDNVTENTDEPPRDPGAGRAHHSYTDKDFQGERNCPIYRGVRSVPAGKGMTGSTYLICYRGDLFKIAR